MASQQPTTERSSGGRWSNLERWQQLAAAVVGLVGTLGAVLLTIALTSGGDDRSPRPPEPGSSTSTVAARPNVAGAAFQSVQLGQQLQGGYQYHLKIQFSGLKGQSCTVVWETLYLDDRTPGDSNGTVTTDTLRYDRVDWAYDVVVRPPSGATSGRQWRPVFKVLSPERVLLATAS